MNAKSNNISVIAIASASLRGTKQSQPLQLLRSSLRDAQRERNDILIFIISSNNKSLDAPRTLFV
ncbi:hypothetical protein H6G81_07615 [Scytonema hofmannii FACHB-248]|uniref:Uncharacterized protein n=1 Tax=Scytonema hofmannii FACHB-248 TaxID=1842502 RepID=A0ABR8GMG1_9CYAN|nr:MULTISPECIES: hypothetical protein [Nostocales]MBD2604402.1 hypothetical protein [Scytonema hofmannii FACHB-248]